MTHGHTLIELSQVSWGELTVAEQEAFSAWLRTAGPQDLYLLICYLKRHFRRSSSVQKLRAVAETNKTLVDTVYCTTPEQVEYIPQD